MTLISKYHLRSPICGFLLQREFPDHLMNLLERLPNYYKAVDLKNRVNNTIQMHCPSLVSSRSDILRCSFGQLVMSLF